MATAFNDADVAEIKFYNMAQGQLGLNVLHYVVAGAIGTVYGDEIASVMATWVPALYQAFMSVDATYAGLSVQKKVHGGPDPVADYDKGGAGAGLKTGDMLPTQICGIITKQTFNTGRRYRGRVYLPFMPESANDANGTPVVGQLTLFSAWATDLLSPITIVNGGGSSIILGPCIWNRGSGTTASLATFRVNGRWATQRRRGAYGRLNTLPPELQ